MSRDRDADANFAIVELGLFLFCLVLFIIFIGILITYSLMTAMYFFGLNYMLSVLVKSSYVHSMGHKLNKSNYTKGIFVVLMLSVIPIHVINIFISKYMCLPYFYLLYQVSPDLASIIAIQKSGIYLSPVCTLLLAHLFISIRWYKKFKPYAYDQYLLGFMGSAIKSFNKRHTFKNKSVRDAIETKHSLILGSTGSGKTYSVLEPMVKRDIISGEAVFILDPKGDRSFKTAVYNYSITAGVEDKFCYFSLSDIDNSFRFNPLGGLDDNSIKDIIISIADYTEPYYKKRCESELLNAISRCRKKYPEKQLTLSIIRDNISDDKDIKGLKADLDILCNSSFGGLINDSDAPSIIDLYLHRCPTFFSLDTQSFPLASVQLGRMILSSLKCLSNLVQTKVPEEERIPTNIFIDEFGSFLTPDFVNFLNKARSSNFRIVMATQSLGDIDYYGESIRKQIIDSTPVKYIMQMSDPDSREWAASLFGTEKTLKSTERYSGTFFKTRTGESSVREVDEFVVHPNRINQLARGEAYILTVSPFSIHHIRFHALYSSICERNDYEYMANQENPDENPGKIVESHESYNVIEHKVSSDVINDLI